jgi:hypothetical protein
MPDRVSAGQQYAASVLIRISGAHLPAPGGRPRRDPSPTCGTTREPHRNHGKSGTGKDTAMPGARSWQTRAGTQT